MVSSQMKHISELAPPATLAARRVAERAYQRGARWATKRFSGGRTGPTPPKPGENRAFNHSSRLANGLFTRFNKTDGSFTTNVPANRFAEDVFDGARRAKAFEKLARLVPALSQPGAIVRDEKVRASVEKSVELMIQKLRSERDIKLAELRRQVVDVGRAIVGLAL